jgi:DNA-binding winged helix-turn-helix (wHTH) protein/Flp pilus assembly protein TadD
MDLCRDHSADCLRFGEFTIDLADERLLGPGGPIKIGHKAYRVLLALIEQDGRLLTKEALFSSVWDGTVVSESALTSVIKELRRALGDGSRSPRFIESVYGRGYRFLASVDTAAAAPPVEVNPTSISERRFPAGVRTKTTPPIVIVARFEDGAVNQDYPHCAAQLREEVLSGLARFREIQLVAEDGVDFRSVAGGVRRGYRLTATLLPDTQGVRVAARACRTTDGRVIWAETLSLSSEGTAAGVEKIVRRIVGSALPAVDNDVSLGLPPVSEAFYDRYLIAKHRSVTATNGRETLLAAEALEALVAERPDFGLAYPPLVRLYNTDFAFTALGGSGEAERKRALDLARAGLAADRGNVHAYTVLGFCYLYHSEPALARSCLEQALALNPYNPVRVNEVAAGMIYLGEFDSARELLDLGLQLQLFADDTFKEDSGLLALVEGDCERARSALMAIAKPSIWAELYLAVAECRLGRASSTGRLVTWLEHVQRGWQNSTALSPERLHDWVRWHQPFQEGAGDSLFSLLDEALVAAPMPQLATMPVPE